MSEEYQYDEKRDRLWRQYKPTAIENICKKKACERLNDLERQLAEAKALVFSAYQEGWNDNRNNLDCCNTHWIDSDSKYELEKIKEQT